MVRRLGSSLASGLWLIACGDPGTLGSVDAPLALASVAPHVHEPAPGEPPAIEVAAPGAAGQPGQGPPPVLRGTPAGRGGAGPLAPPPGEPPPGEPPPEERDDPPTDAGVQSADDADGGAGEGGSPLPAGEHVDAGARLDAGTGGAALDAGVLPSDFRLAIVGSSTAAGDGASSPASAWSSRLEVRLNARLEGELELHNFASGGFTSAELLPGSGHPGSIDAAIAVDPDLVLVALAGSNDLSAGTTGAELIARLGRLREAALAAGIPVFFLSTAPKSLSQPEREQLAAWATSLGQSFTRCPVPGQPQVHAPCFVDVFTPLADTRLGLAAAYDSGDGIHINDAGHALIYDRVRGIVEPYVCSRARCR